MSTKLSPGPRALAHSRAGFRWARLVAPAAMLVAAAFPASAFADTSGKLPQGYTTDALPQLPPKSTPDAGAAIAQPASDVTVEGDAYIDTDPSALSDFREPLAPYGAWVVDPTYGTVWVPSTVVVGADFAPYQTAGHWETTVDGDWLWVSDYSWGYIPFHYGRWVWIAGTGWGWIPGRVYAPAWVVWRVGDGGYIGWAAMPPAYYWNGGVAVSLWVVPPAAYVFCPTSYVFHHHVHTYIVHDHAKVRDVARGTRPYKPANPTAGGGGGGGSKYKPANPSPGKQASSGSARGGFGPASPSFEEARIPQSSRPRARTSGDATALRYARPSTTPRAAASRGSFHALPGSSGARDVPSVSRGPGATAPPTAGSPSIGGRQAVPSAPPPPSRSATSTPSRRSSSGSTSSSSSNDSARSNDSTRSPSAPSSSPSFGGSSRSPSVGQPPPAARPAAKPSARPSAGPSRGGGRGRR